MKPTVTVDTKTDKTTDITPVQVYEKEMAPQKWNVSGKHVLIAVTSLLTVALVVAGFVSAFYILKTTSDKHSDNMTKVFQMRVRDGNTVIKEKIKTNIAENTTEVDTVDDRGQDAIIYNDFKKGITVFVIEGRSAACYVSPMDNNETETPEILQKYLETHPNHDVDTTNIHKENHLMVPSQSPISDSTFLGTKINGMCSNRAVYWLYPQPTNTGLTSRRKRNGRETVTVCKSTRILGIKVYEKCVTISRGRERP